MSYLKQELIRLGSKQPELRAHIQPVLRYLEAADAKVEELFGELRSAISQYDVPRILELEDTIKSINHGYLLNIVRPYLTNLLMRKIQKAKPGDQLILMRATLPKPAVVTVVRNMKQTQQSEAYHPKVVLLTKPSHRGRKIGELLYEPQGDMLYYRANLQTPLFRVVLIK